MTARPDRPEWAQHALDALTDAVTDALTHEELLLLDGIHLRLRGRLGETSKHGLDLTELGNDTIRHAADGIAKETGNGGAK